MTGTVVLTTTQMLVARTEIQDTLANWLELPADAGGMIGRRIQTLRELVIILNEALGDVT